MSWNMPLTSWKPANWTLHQLQRLGFAQEGLMLQFLEDEEVLTTAKHKCGHDRAALRACYQQSTLRDVSWHLGLSAAQKHSLAAKMVEQDNALTEMLLFLATQGAVIAKGSTQEGQGAALQACMLMAGAVEQAVGLDGLEEALLRMRDALSAAVVTPDRLKLPSNWDDLSQLAIQYLRAARDSREALMTLLLETDPPGLCVALSWCLAHPQGKPCTRVGLDMRGAFHRDRWTGKAVIELGAIKIGQAGTGPGKVMRQLKYLHWCARAAGRVKSSEVVELLGWVAVMQPGFPGTSETGDGYRLTVEEIIAH